jgi:hypothetical protein
VYYRADSDFASPGALAKAKLGRLPASDILDIELATALKAEGIDPSKLRLVSLNPGRIVAAFADRSIDAAIGSAWEVPFLAREKGIALKSFNPADYRVEFYGDTLFTLRRLAKAEPQLVRSFRAASLKGWLRAAASRRDRPTAVELPPRRHYRPAGLPAIRARSHAASRFIDPLASNPDRRRIEASSSGSAPLRTPAPTISSLTPCPGAQRTDLRFRSWATLAGGLAVALWLRAASRFRRNGVAQAPNPPSRRRSLARCKGPASGCRRRPGIHPNCRRFNLRRSNRHRSAAGSPAVAAARASPPGPADLNASGRLERSMRVYRAACRLSLLPELWRCRANRDGGVGADSSPRPATI